MKEEIDGMADRLAAEIRRVDGNHSMGAGALAEALIPFIARALAARAGGEPDTALLESMATCLNHGFVLDNPERQLRQLNDMRKLWLEVMGRGYYKPENRERYRAMLPTAPLPTRGGV